MHPNEPESMNSGLAPPLCLGLCLGLVHFAQYLQHSYYLLRLKQQITNCFNISFFDLIHFFFIKFILTNIKTMKLTKKNILKTIVDDMSTCLPLEPSSELALAN